MDIDFALVLVCLVGFTGFLWLVDSLLLKKTLQQAVSRYQATTGKGRSEDDIAAGITLFFN